MTTRLLDLADHSTFDAHGRAALQYRQIKGVRVVLEWCARRLITPRDGIPWALGTCIDLGGYVGATTQPGFLDRLKAACDAQLAQVEYVVGVSSTLKLEDERLEYAPNVRLVNGGTYELAVTIDKAGAALARFPIL